MGAWRCENIMNMPLGAGRRPILAIWVHHRVACWPLWCPLIVLVSAKEIEMDHEMLRECKTIIPVHHQAIMGRLQWLQAEPKCSKWISLRCSFSPQNLPIDHRAL